MSHFLDYINFNIASHAKQKSNYVVECSDESDETRAVFDV